MFLHPWTTRITILGLDICILHWSPRTRKKFIDDTLHNPKTTNLYLLHGLGATPWFFLSFNILLVNPLQDQFFGLILHQMFGWILSLGSLKVTSFISQTFKKKSIRFDKVLWMFQITSPRWRSFGMNWKAIDIFPTTYAPLIVAPMALPCRCIKIKIMSYVFSKGSIKSSMPPNLK